MGARIGDTAYLRKSWAAVAVLALGFAATLAVWHILSSHERVQVRWAGKLAADAIQSDLVESVQWQIFGLDRLALLWEAADPLQTIWKDNAELYIQHRPGCVAVEWLTPDGNKRVAVKAAGPKDDTELVLAEIPKSLIESAAASQTARISTLIPLNDGSKQYAVAYPVYARGQLRGFVVSYFEFARSLGYILDDLKPLGFSLELSQSDQHEYLLFGGNREDSQEWGTTAEVSVLGAIWQIRVWPKPDVLDRIKSRIPQTTLLVGGILSLLLALVTHFGISAGRKSAHIRQINEQLRLEVETRREAQEELVRAHSELEVRVQKRTAELAAANSSLQELTGRLFQSRDEERRRLARELHDGATQKLIALAMNIATLRNDVVTRDDQHKVMSDSARLIQESIQELRTTSHLLHPPLIDELGLPVTLRSYVDGFAARSGIEIVLALDQDLQRLEHDAELAIFRIVQESLTNIHRHSHSTTAAIALSSYDGEVHLEISDHGTGIPPDVLATAEHGTAGVGIAGMRERVRLLSGHFDIKSDEHGTTIHIVLPVSTGTLSRAQLSVVA